MYSVSTRDPGTSYFPKGVESNSNLNVPRSFYATTDLCLGLEANFYLFMVNQAK